MDCPYCPFTATDQRGLASHFRHQASTHPDYATWLNGQRFTGKVEGPDFVVCRECGHRAESLARHLKAAHGITADAYKVKYPDALIRASLLTTKRQEALREGRKSAAYAGTKPLACLACGRTWDASKFAGPDTACPSCKQATDEARWAGLTEPEDFVSCVECAYRAENLTAHVQHAHPGYRDRHPDAPLVALNSAVRDKTALRGRTLPEVTKAKMSKNAGRWNAGLTKATDPRLAGMAEKMAGRPAWNAGRTAENDARVAETARKLRFYTGEARPWDNGLAANLTLSDFETFMDAEGRVDHQKVIEATGVSWVTVRRYIADLGLQQTRRYIEDAAEDRTIRIEKEALAGFTLKNGKVHIGRAMSGLRHDFRTIQRECQRHGLPVFTHRVTQTLCLDALSGALGGVPYEQEWTSRRFLNPKTGHRFRFDGFFPDLGLVVEFHGHQHYIFPSFYIKEGYAQEYEALRERDRVKRAMIEAAPDLIYFEVREDEPYTSLDYLRGRLVQAGFFR